MTKKERSFLWLKIIHTIDDIDLSKISNIHKVIADLDKQYSLKERKFKSVQKEEAF